MAGPEIVFARAAGADGAFDVDAVRAIEQAAAVAHGHAVLGDAVWRDLAEPQADSAGFFARSPEGGHLGYVHVARADAFAVPHWIVGLVCQPRTGDRTAAPALLGAAQRWVADHGGGRVVAWQFDPTEHDDAVLCEAGFAPARDLHEMRVCLPLPEAPAWPEGVEVRAFRPGVDDAAWLEVNNRAFADHPEQGGWTAATLVRRTGEAWFDPGLFVMAFDAGTLVGFNWLKVHEADTDGPRRGEIYVIGTDPAAQGRGLGRALALEGLARVAVRGITTAMLFVAAENRTAIALYRSLGFHLHRIDRAYEREVPPA